MGSKVQLSDIQKKAFFYAPIEQVWEAVATSEGLASWFMLNDFQPVEGHRFELNKGQFGVSPCIVTKLDAPTFLSFSWGKDWNVSFHLKDHDDVTEFTVIHSGWDADKITEYRASHLVVHENMEIGWTNLVKKLYKYLDE